MIDSRNQSRKLGQHFLINKQAIQKIIAALDLQKNDTVVEIGPGKGALTIPLAQKCQASGVKCQVIAIEKDPRLADQLTSYADATVGEFKIIHGDALKLINSQTHQLTNWKLVGNIPYYITGKLLRILSEMEHKPRLTVLTLQKEVAERLCAHPTPTKTCPTHRCAMCGMNLLAAAVQIWAEPKIFAYLKPKDFSPPPKVHSAVIKLTPNLRRCERLRLDDYYKLIKTVFKQPRKTVLNNLSTGLKISKEVALEMLKKVGLKGDERPQNLSLESLIKLSTIK